MIKGALSMRFGRDAEARAPVRKFSGPKQTSIYAVGDIHGRADLLGDIRERIRIDAGKRARGNRKVIVYLGDYIDRGAQSRQVIELLLSAPLEGFEEIHLMGNHEDYMLEFLAGRADGFGWLFNGGEATIASYGVAPVGSSYLDPDAIEELRGELGAAVPDDHRAFLADLKLHHREGGYLFVHAGIRPQVPLAEQSAEDLMWIRDDFLKSKTDHDCRVVHGHTITWSPEVRRNRIGIDTGAFLSGTLTCLVIEGSKTRFLTAVRKIDARAG